MLQKSLLACAAALAVMAAATPAAAIDMNTLTGTWKWTDFTMQAKPCTTNPSGAGLCMTVTAGPKNVGLEMIRSKFARSGRRRLCRQDRPSRIR